MLFLLPVFVFSQTEKEQGLNSINKGSAEAYVGFLADDLLEGRKMGERGNHIASEYIKSVLFDIGIKPFFSDSYFQHFSACRKNYPEKGRYMVHPDSVSKYRDDLACQKLELKNILGCIEGKNNEEYVIIGAHYDHLGMDESLAGDKIYNGADDNASGVSAVLQIARAFMLSGEKPERTIVFALWDGEEAGLLGSQFFTSTCPDLSRIKGYINFDMIGRNNDESNPNHIVYFYTAANPAFQEWSENDILKYELALKPVYKAWDKMDSGSDNASFGKRGIPVIWYHTDGHPDYHKPSDHADKINWTKLVDITKAAYLNAWNMANQKNY